ncbi:MULTISPECIES: 4-hydroxy-tetrahydrodipicolinate reductase [unclassified Curtobacterium]|uniref:4-hydroxy-tetrahydrodipicolinate reductase n=1 Tax=unclassified Curtobacterium TaxID=257496 RepID=UPI0008DCAE87|nr:MULTISPECIES: 4-hydroxy-tetrahydrodipicolinate reductase [unclassified Curtobacterium]OIH98999.1 4-hydroxy-tetrahydrodipicolinate reductase [Curtobacterium sp. MCBA15_003]OII31234.1 4-hydroxy-tetrahydrodipicolinate reductase [Curtobacterium sp. MMLR14_006]
MVTPVAVVGATGRLGGLVAAVVQELPELELVASLSSKDGAHEADPQVFAGARVVVDVTVPALSPAIVENALSSGANVLVGTSGWSADRLATLRSGMQDRPEQGVLVVPNFSIGSVLGTHLATIAAPWFPAVEIIETHHAGKIDSPSGTAVRTAELVADARRDVGPVDAPHVDQRARGQQVASVPIHSLRLPGVKAVQDVLLSGPGETLTIRHDTNDDVAYVAGIRAALGAVGAARGLTVGLGSVLGIG